MTNLDRFVVKPTGINNSNIWICYFEPGMHENVQCFSAPGDFNTAKNFVLNSQQCDHPDAVIIELAIDTQSLPILQANGKLIFGNSYGRAETIFKEEFLATEASFKVFDAHSL